jgi:hypothetical protein
MHAPEATAVRCLAFKLTTEENARKSDNEAVILDESFDTLAEKARAAFTGAHSEHLHVRDGEIKGIEAPKPVLTAGNDKFSAYIDARGVHASDLTDQHNEPRLCTHNQSEDAAYRLAAKVWPKVQAATTFSEAWQLLRDAGCKLHYWCAVD